MHTNQASRDEFELQFNHEPILELGTVVLLGR